LGFITKIYHDARSSECQILRMNIRCLCVGEDEIPVLWEPLIPLMATTSPLVPVAVHTHTHTHTQTHTHWLPSEIKIF